MNNFSPDPKINVFWEGRSDSSWSEPWRRIYDCELVYVSSGECIFNLEGRSHALSEGNLLIIGPGIWHETIVLPQKKVMRHCVHFDWTPQANKREAPLMALRSEKFDRRLAHPLPLEVQGILPLLQNVDDNSLMRKMLNDLFDALRSREAFAERYLWPILKSIISNADSESKPEQTHLPSASGKPLRSVLTLKHLIETRFREPLGYDDFCRATRLTKSHLCDIFSRTIGVPPTTYLNNIRLEHAARQLVESDLNISEICRSVGIEDANYFARIFRKNFGITPSAYLRQHSEQNKR